MAKDVLKLTRTERRQRESRWKLLWATLSSVGRNGVDGASILDITARADVATGSFYNYFENKEAAIHAVIAELLGPWRAALFATFYDIPDPAERVAIKTRHAMQRGMQDPDWAMFFVRTAWLMSSKDAEFPAGLLPDLQEGLESGRFKGGSLEMTAVSVLGALYISTARLIVHNPHPEAVRLTTHEILRLLGIEEGEAERLIAAPLPPLNLPAILVSPQALPSK